MTWPTTDGVRSLEGVEADLVRRVAGMMVDQLVAEGSEATAQHEYGISLFDQWDWQQRLWMLDKTVGALLTNQRPPDAAAIFEATIEAVFAEAGGLIEFEIEGTGKTSIRPTWRQTVVAVAAKRRIRSDVADDDTDIAAWQTLLMRLRESIFGPSSYIQAEAHRDGAYEVTAKFLQSRGLPTDFLARIPRLRNLDQTQRSIDRLQSLIFR